MTEFATRDRPEQVVSQFRELKKALIDASSMIYMTKAGYLNLVTDCLELHSPKKVIQETGYENLKIHELIVDDIFDSADQLLVFNAFRLGWPLITEDQGIIRQLETQKTPYFNALMILEFMYWKRVLSHRSYIGHHRKLLKHAWYSSEVLEFCDAVHQILERNRKCS